MLLIVICWGIEVVICSEFFLVVNVFFGLYVYEIFWVIIFCIFIFLVVLIRLWVFFVLIFVLFLKFYDDNDVNWWIIILGFVFFNIENIVFLLSILVIIGMVFNFFIVFICEVLWIIVNIVCLFFINIGNKECFIILVVFVINIFIYVFFYLIIINVMKYL